jgi:uncharacterized protein
MEKELKDYIIKEVKSKYKTFDKGHNISHFNFVTKNCILYGKELIKQGYNIDLDIAYIVGAYHDIGIAFGRDGHAKKSAEYVRNDKMLAKYYNTETINMIAEAVEDHSSRLEYEPRNIYGKLVADADRNNTLYLVFSRPIKFSVKNHKEFSRQEHIDSVYDFVQSKFGRNGYVKYWLDIRQTKQEQQQIFSLLDDKQLAKSYIAGIYDEVTKGKK